MKTLTLPATLESLSPLGQFILEVAAEAHLDKVIAYRARLAVDEIATNAILYGGAAGEDGTGVLALHADVKADAMTVILEDGGTPFDARDAAPPDDIDAPLEERKIGGLGVYLALTGVDHFSYERVNARNRNVFVVKRPTSPRTATEGTP